MPNSELVLLCFSIATVSENLLSQLFFFASKSLCPIAISDFAKSRKFEVKYLDNDRELADDTGWSCRAQSGLSNWPYTATHLTTTVEKNQFKDSKFAAIILHGNYFPTQTFEKTLVQEVVFHCILSKLRNTRRQGSFPSSIPVVWKDI